ncbi:MAG TPA: hypothetical protein VEB43_19775 [Anaeromyxobacter sp.]|nr:hypothetical protein [Anaeromyxobacter sp.]
MAAKHIEALPTDAIAKREGLRLLGAVAILLAAALVMAGGLLWREHARGRPQPAAVSVR